MTQTEFSPDPQPQHVRMLRAIRQQRGWSQAQLGKQLQVSQRTIMRWESGEHDPPLYLMAALRELMLMASGGISR